MSMPISNGNNVEVVTSVQRFRRWTLEEKIGRVSRAGRLCGKDLFDETASEGSFFRVFSQNIADESWRPKSLTLPPMEPRL
jgi:hypothetical protein